MLRLLRAALIGSATLAAAATCGAAPAASPAQRYAERALKAAFTGWAKKNLPGTTVGKVSCVLPLSGSVARCTIHVSAPRNRENIVFRVTNTLHTNGTATFAMLSHSCTDSRTGKKIAC
jgi:hypothetical protein